MTDFFQIERETKTLKLSLFNFIFHWALLPTIHFWLWTKRVFHSVPANSKRDKNPIPWHNVWGVHTKRPSRYIYISIYVYISFLTICQEIWSLPDWKNYTPRIFFSDSFQIERNTIVMTVFLLIILFPLVSFGIPNVIPFS